MIGSLDSRTFRLHWRESRFPTAFFGKSEHNVLTHTSVSRCLIKWKSSLFSFVLLSSCFLCLTVYLSVLLSVCLSFYLSFSICLSVCFYFYASLSFFFTFSFLSIVKASPKLREKQKTHSVWLHKNCYTSIRPAFFGATTSFGDDFLEYISMITTNKYVWKRNRNLFCKDINFRCSMIIQSWRLDLNFVGWNVTPKEWKSSLCNFSSNLLRYK